MLDGKKSQVSRRSDASGGLIGHQNHVRLPDTHQAELVQRYLDGASKKELAQAYGIHVETMRPIIRRAEPRR